MNLGHQGICLGAPLQPVARLASKAVAFSVKKAGLPAALFKKGKIG
jgi:hypothetical protein